MMTEVSVTGQFIQSFIAVTFAFLGTGTMVATLKRVGTADLDRERLNMSVNTPASCVRHFNGSVTAFVLEMLGLLRAFTENRPKFESQMTPYSLHSALLLTRAHIGCHLGHKPKLSHIYN